jgi:hypothetical protein
MERHEAHGSQTEEDPAAVNEAIYARLRDAAQRGQLLTYSEIAPLAGLDMESPEDRVRLGKILGDISSKEHAEGRPLLSVIVVHAVDSSPGEGFFKLARELGRLGKGKEIEFFAEEARRVFDLWARSSPQAPPKQATKS